jgi:arylsulfatase A-like enzyme
MSALLRFAALVAVFGATSEVALRASPRMGLDAGQVAVWLAFAVVCSLACTLPTALLTRRRGLVVGVYVGLLAAVNYRFEFVLNNFVRDWRVWAVMPALFAAGVVVGWALERLWARVPRATWIFPALFVGAAFVRANSASGAASDRPNVLVISLDTTRWDHVADKPHLARLIREGTSFSQAIANAPITEPGHLAMLTGISPYRSGIVSNGTDLGDRPALLWRALQPRGWLSAAFVSGFPLHSKYGWSQGIDVYDDDFGALPGREALSIVKAWNQVAVKEHALRERPAQRTLSHALPWLRAHRDETFLAFVHFYDAHGPYESEYNAQLGPPPTEGAALDLPAYWPARDRAITSTDWLSRAYDGEVRHTDDAIGELLDVLAPVLDKTIVIVTADHGESLTEHHYLFDHGDNLYDPSLRVPLVVRYPPAVKAGQVVPCQVASIDVTPTLLDLLGVQDGQARDGVSRVPELRGDACRAEPVVASATTGRFVEKPPVDHALRAEGEKLILHEGGATELYDLAADPDELRNRSGEPRSKEVEALLRHMLGGAGEVTGPNADAETRKMLEELGYLNGGEP